jgi:D-glycero-beta-D-manno-heptose-7-phosphate kinase
LSAPTLIPEIFSSFQAQRILVIGDVMLDAYYMGSVDRISPEAPVPVVSVTNKERRPGGAANVAFNIHSLGATPIICAVRGNDLEGEWLKSSFEDAGLESSGLIVDHNRSTTIKTRIIGNQQQVLRVDEETTGEIDREVENEVYGFIQSKIDKVDAIIFQDYNKGLLTKSLISKVVKLAKSKSIPTLVDPKKEHFYDYKEVDLFKPNCKEIIEGLKLDSSLDSEKEVHDALVLLAQKLKVDQILLTLSQDGVAMYSNGETNFYPAYPRKILDVSGAGDSVISVAALCVGLKLDWSLVAQLSNLAGGLVCEKLGVVPVDREVLLAESVANFQ